jgi:hypothetical protein
MPSNRKAESNRRNSRRSTGPRTAAGKATAALNSFKHGLAALECHRPAPSAELAEFALALCGDDRHPAVFAQALKVAESHMMLGAVLGAKVAAVERLRDRHVTPFVRKDPLLDEAKAHRTECQQAELAIKARLPELFRKYKAEMLAAMGPKGLASANTYQAIMRRLTLNGAFTESDAVWMIVEVLLDEEKSLDNETLERARKAIEARQRDEHDALKAAAPDLVRLDRYECRAWSRQKRAIEEFMMIKAQARSAKRIPAGEQGAVCERQVLTEQGFQ